MTETTAVEFLVKPEWAAEGYGVRVQATGAFVTTLSGLAAAVPDLPARARADRRYVGQLAAAVGAVGVGDRYVPVLRQADLDEFQKKLDGPPVVDREACDPGQAVSAPSGLALPALDGERLVLTAYQEYWASPTAPAFLGQRVTFSFGPGGWTSTKDPLPEAARPQALAPQLTALFGGEVAGTVRVMVGDDAVFFGLAPRAGASSVALRTKAGVVSGYPSLAALVKAHPALGTPAALGAMAQRLYDTVAAHALNHARYAVIGDPKAYLEEYRASGWGVHKLRYWVDQLKTTTYALEAPERLAAPRLEGDQLVTFVTDTQHQPYLLTLEVGALRWDTPLKPEPRHRVVSVHDTRDGPKSPEGPPESADLPVPLRDPAKRLKR